MDWHCCTMNASQTKWNKNNGNHNAFKAYHCSLVPTQKWFCVRFEWGWKKKKSSRKFIAKTQIECVAKWENNKINKQINGIDGNFGKIVMIHAQSKHIQCMHCNVDTSYDQPSNHQCYTNCELGDDSIWLEPRYFSTSFTLMCTHALFLIESITIHWRRISIRWIFQVLVAASNDNTHWNEGWIFVYHKSTHRGWGWIESIFETKKKKEREREFTFYSSCVSSKSSYEERIRLK